MGIQKTNKQKNLSKNDQEQPLKYPIAIYLFVEH